MEKNHPIGDLMSTTMQKIREMVDVNTIIGTPIRTDDGITLIPVSKLSFGFASGGSDFMTKNQKPEADNAFGGGSGAGVNISGGLSHCQRRYCKAAARGTTGGKHRGSCGGAGAGNVR